MAELENELQTVAEIMAQGIDPKRLRSWKPWWPLGGATIHNVNKVKPKGTEFRLKTESGDPADDERKIIKGFVPTNWRKR